LDLLVGAPERLPSHRHPPWRPLLISVQESVTRDKSSSPTRMNLAECDLSWSRLTGQPGSTTARQVNMVRRCCASRQPRANCFRQPRFLVSRPFIDANQDRFWMGADNDSLFGPEEGTGIYFVQIGASKARLVQATKGNVAGMSGSANTMNVLVIQNSLGYPFQQKQVNYQFVATN